MQNLRRPDRRQVAIALVADHDAVRMAALYRGRNRGRASMRCLDIAHIEVVVREDRAADRADQNRPVLNAELVDGVRQHLVHDAVSAPGTIVRLVLQLFFALVDRRKKAFAFE